ncbi:putative C6 transcription factor [Naviculisporaceae sp. PSN 640]
MSEIIPESKVKHRRRRPAVSCTLCRKRKIRCNRDSPCSNCVRSRNQTCVYDASVQLPASHSPVSPSQLTVPPFQRGRSRSTSNLHSEQSPGNTGRANTLPFPSSNSPSSTRDADLESLRNQVRQLEEQLQHQGRSNNSQVEPLNQSIETTTSELAGTFHVQHESRPNDQPSRARLVHKARVFGQSHWSNGVIQFRDIFHAIDPVLRQRPSKATANLNKCKSLAKFIQTQMLPSWPTTFSSTSLPERGLADRLVHCYLETIETVYRILHIPTFQEEYEGIWSLGYNNDLEQDGAIQIQIKLVLAIGAVSYDESFSLRTSALQWVYEAQAWASEPDLKLQINIRYIQNSILLLLARELVGVGGDLVWVSAGSLVRTAMYIGLHRDPSRLPNRSFLDSEMHRRLWNTIIEVSLSASMSSGGPVLISLSDFDTPPPGNFDDEQLSIPTIHSGGHQQRPLPKAEGDWTETSLAIAFRQTFPLRLAIAKILNDLSSTGTYQETLKLDSELRATYKVLCQTLQKCRESSYSSNKGRRGPSQFASNWVDFQMHRYLAALHSPFFGPALKETAYAFSRKVVVETSLKIWRAVYPGPSSPPQPATGIQITMANNNEAVRQSVAASSQGDVNFLERLAICGSGYIRTVPLLAAAAIAAELRTQLQEESTSLGSVSVRPDLLAVVHDARAWRLKCLSAGELNVKTFMLASLIAAQIDGLIQGLGKESLTMFLVEAAEKTGAEALEVFEATAARFLHSGYPGGTLRGMDSDVAGVNGGDAGAAVGALYFDDVSLSGGGHANSSAGTSVDFMEGWDFMVSAQLVIVACFLSIVTHSVLLPPQRVIYLALTSNTNSIKYQKQYLVADQA